MAEQNTQSTRDGNVKKIRDLIKEIEFAMLTTTDENNQLQSRPMHTQKVEFDGDIYFFSYSDSNKAEHINRNPNVNLAYSSPNNQTYISLNGSAEISKDRQKMEELWQPQLKAWFPDELQTPNIALVKVHIRSAEYWDAPSSTVSHIVGLVQSTVTGKPANVGEDVTVQLDN